MKNVGVFAVFVAIFLFAVNVITLLAHSFLDAEVSEDLHFGAAAMSVIIGLAGAFLYYQ